MSDPEWTEEEKNLLKSASLLREIQQRQNPATAKAETKPRWERVLNATAVTALIGVLGTGLLGNWIAGNVQRTSKQQELAALAYGEYLNAQLTTMKEVYDLVGAYVSASEDLIFLSGPAFQDSAHDPANRPTILAQKKAMRDAYNEIDATWRRKHVSLGLLISHYHEGSAEIAARWREVAAAVDAFNLCAVAWDSKHPAGAKQEDLDKGPCTTAKDRIASAIDDLNEQIEGSRAYLWSELGVRNTKR